MGMSVFSSCMLYESNNIQAPNPDPVNFKVLTTIQVGSIVVTKIQYPNCINYEGIKICVFQNTTEKDLLNRETIDPHFAKSINTPIARFVPTEQGLSLVIKLANFIIEKEYMFTDLKIVNTNKGFIKVSGRKINFVAYTEVSRDIELCYNG